MATQTSHRTTREAGLVKPQRILLGSLLAKCSTAALFLLVAVGKLATLGKKWVITFLTRAVDSYDLKFDALPWYTAGLQPAADKVVLDLLHLRSQTALQRLVQVLVEVGYADFASVHVVSAEADTFAALAKHGQGSSMMPRVLDELAGSVPSNNLFGRCVFHLSSSHWSLEELLQCPHPLCYDSPTVAQRRNQPVGCGVPEDVLQMHQAGLQTVLVLPCMEINNKPIGALVVGLKTGTGMTKRRLSSFCRLTTLASPWVSHMRQQLAPSLQDQQLANKFRASADIAHDLLSEALNLDRMLAQHLRKDASLLRQSPLAARSQNVSGVLHTAASLSQSQLGKLHKYPAFAAATPTGQPLCAAGGMYSNMYDSPTSPRHWHSHLLQSHPSISPVSGRQSMLLDGTRCGSSEYASSMVSLGELVQPQDKRAATGSLDATYDVGTWHVTGRDDLSLLYDMLPDHRQLQSLHHPRQASCHAMSAAASSGRSPSVASLNFQRLSSQQHHGQVQQRLSCLEDALSSGSASLVATLETSSYHLWDLLPDRDHKNAEASSAGSNATSHAPSQSGDSNVVIGCNFRPVTPPATDVQAAEHLHGNLPEPGSGVVDQLPQDSFTLWQVSGLYRSPSNNISPLLKQLDSIDEGPMDQLDLLNTDDLPHQPAIRCAFPWQEQLRAACSTCSDADTTIYSKFTSASFSNRSGPSCSLRPSMEYPGQPYTRPSSGNSNAATNLQQASGYGDCSVMNTHQDSQVRATSNGHYSQHPMLSQGHAVAAGMHNYYANPAFEHNTRPNTDGTYYMLSLPRRSHSRRSYEIPNNHRLPSLDESGPQSYSVSGKRNAQNPWAASKTSQPAAPAAWNGLNSSDFPAHLRCSRQAAEASASFWSDEAAAAVEEARRFSEEHEAAVRRSFQGMQPSRLSSQSLHSNMADQSGGVHLPMQISGGQLSLPQQLANRGGHNLESYMSDPVYTCREFTPCLGLASHSLDGTLASGRLTSQQRPDSSPQERRYSAAGSHSSGRCSNLSLLCSSHDSGVQRTASLRRVSRSESIKSVETVIEAEKADTSWRVNVLQRGNKLPLALQGMLGLTTAAPLLSRRSSSNSRRSSGSGTVNSYLLNSGDVHF